MVRKISLTAVASLALCVHLAAQAQSVEDMQVGDAVAGAFEMGSTRLVVPEGSWQVVAIKHATATIGSSQASQVETFPVATVLMAQVQDHQIKALLRYAGNTETLPPSVEVSMTSHCVRDNSGIYFKNDFNSSGAQSECLIVRPAYAFLHHTGGYWDSVNGWLKQHAITTPETAIYVDYSLHGAGKFVQASLWLNPELAGFKPETADAPEQNGWTPVVRDPVRLAFLSRIKAGSMDFAHQIHQGFDGVRTPALPLPGHL